MLGALATAFMSVSTCMPQEPITVVLDVQYSDVARQSRRNSLDLYLPKTEQPPPIVMFVHGGSWIGGRKEGFRKLARMFAANGYACAAINTQMFPFVKPDTMVADCGRALGFLHQNAKRYGFDGDQLFVMGHSSGAHLVSWLALDDDQLRAAGVPKKALKGAILLSGVYDVRARHAAIDAVFGKDPDFRAQASPWLHVDADDPPVFLAWGQYDMPGLAMCARVLRDSMQSLGVPVLAQEYKGCNHVDYVFAIGTARDRVSTDVLHFLEYPRSIIPPSNKRGRSRAVVMWVATCDRERAAGVSLREALRPRGIEVLVQDLEEVNSQSVVQAFTQLQVDLGRRKPPLTFYLAGMEEGGLAVATAPLSLEANGLAGRFLVATPLGVRSLRSTGRRLADVNFGYLKEASLLSIVGDQDAKACREESRSRTAALVRRGYDAHPIELPSTKAEDAVLAMRPGDNLLVPVILAFLYPRGQWRK